MNCHFCFGVFIRQLSLALLTYSMNSKNIFVITSTGPTFSYQSSILTGWNQRVFRIIIHRQVQWMISNSITCISEHLFIFCWQYSFICFTFPLNKVLEKSIHFTHEIQIIRFLMIQLNFDRLEHKFWPGFSHRVKSVCQNDLDRMVVRVPSVQNALNIVQFAQFLISNKVFILKNKGSDSNATTFQYFHKLFGNILMYARNIAWSIKWDKWKWYTRKAIKN